MERGRFITFEGIDGAGKSTHVPWFADRLVQRGYEVITTREPGGTAIGEQLRTLLLREAMTPDTEALLMFAARREHLEKVIWPGLNAGKWIVCDRFTDASLAYQGGGRGLPLVRLYELERWTHPHFQPDLTLLFDVPQLIAYERLAKHATQRDRFEREAVDFFERVRGVYLQRAQAHPERFRIIDSTQPLETVRVQLGQIVAAL